MSVDIQTRIEAGEDWQLLLCGLGTKRVNCACSQASCAAATAAALLAPVSPTSALSFTTLSAGKTAWKVIFYLAG